MSKMVNVRVSGKVFTDLSARAEREGTTVSDLVRRAAEVAATDLEGRLAALGEQVAAAEERISLRIKEFRQKAPQEILDLVAQRQAQAVNKQQGR